MAYNPNNPNGQASKANSAPVVIASDDDLQSKLGIVTETAPGTDTASSGLNGRLQRIAQRLTSLIGLFPSALGQTTKSGSLSVTLASDQDTLSAQGNIAHDEINSGNPILQGYEAIAHGTNPTAVAAADRTKGYANRAGIPFIIGGHPNIQSAEYFTSGAITDDNILPAISAGTKYVITSITVTCSSANATTPSVRIGFGATTLTAQGATNADAVTKIILSHPGIPAGSGIVKGNGAGIVGIGGDGEELRITCTTPTTSLIVQVDYFTIES